MNDYFPLLLVFGFVITFAIFVIIVFAPRNYHIDDEEILKKSYRDELNNCLNMVERLRKENLELRALINERHIDVEG